MSNQSIVEHKANMFYVEFREDYLALCLACTYKKPVKGKDKSKASAYCKALILAISEGWTNEKRGTGTDLSFYMTYPQWCESMYGMFGRNVVIDSVDELIGEGLLSRDPIKMYGKDTYRYLLNYAEINRRMKDLADRAPYNTHPQVNALISKRDDKSTGLQVNGMAFTNQRDTRLQVNEDAFTKGRNIESTYHPYTEPTQNTEGTYSASDENATQGANAQPAPDASSSESYVPDFTSKRQSKAASEVRREQDSVAPAGGYVKSAEKPVQATLTGTAPVASAVKEKKPLTLKAQVDLAFRWLDAVRQEAENNPAASYVASGANKKRIEDLIVACWNTPNEITEANVRMVWLAMWNAGTWKDGRSWQDPGMLTIEAICKHYGDYLARGRAAIVRKPSAPPPTSASLPSYSHMSDEEYYASLRQKGSNNARATYAR